MCLQFCQQNEFIIAGLCLSEWSSIWAIWCTGYKAIECETVELSKSLIIWSNRMQFDFHFQRGNQCNYFPWKCTHVQYVNIGNRVKFLVVSHSLFYTKPQPQSKASRPPIKTSSWMYGHKLKIQLQSTRPRPRPNWIKAKQNTWLIYCSAMHGAQYQHYTGCMVNGLMVIQLFICHVAIWINSILSEYSVVCIPVCVKGVRLILSHDIQRYSIISVLLRSTITILHEWQA